MNKICKHEFLKDIWLMLVSFVVLFFYTVIYRIFDITNAETSDIRLTSYTAIMLPMFFLVALLAIYLLSYKNSREKLDLLHSLPISRSKYFLIQYFKGLIYFSVTYFVCMFTAAIIDLIYYPQYTVITSYFILLVFKYWLITTLIYNIFVFANTICAMSIYSIFFGIYFIIFPFITTELVSTYTYKNHPNFSQSFGDFGSFFEINVTKDFYSSGIYYSIPTYLLTLVAFLILNIALVYVALKFYNRFKTENTASPIGFEKLKTLLIIASVFSVTTFVALILLQTRSTNISFTFGITIIILPVISLLAELLIHEGYRNIKLKKALLNIMVTFIIVFSYYGLIFSNIQYNSVIDIDADDVVFANVYKDSERYFCYDDADIETVTQMYKNFENNIPESYYERERARYITPSTTNDDYIKMHHFHFSFTLENEKYISHDYALNDEEYELVKQYLDFELGATRKEYITLLPEIIDKFDLATFYVNNNNYNRELQYYFKPYEHYYPFQENYTHNGQALKNAVLFDIENSKTTGTEEFAELPILEFTVRENNYNGARLTFDIDKSFTNTLDILFNTEYDLGKDFVVYDIDKNFMDYYTKNMEPSKYEIPGYTHNSEYSKATKMEYTYTTNKSTIMSFDSYDVFDEVVDVKVFTGVITQENIDKYNLKIITINKSNTYYVGIID